MYSTLSCECPAIGRRVSVAISMALALVCGLLLARPASAQNIDVSLNLVYNDPTMPATSNGAWQLVAKSSASTFGIFSLDVFLQGVVSPPSVPIGPRGVVNGNKPAGFSELTVFQPTAGVVELIIGQRPLGAGQMQPGDEQSVFYGVGTLANGHPGDIGPTFSSLTNQAAIPWATGGALGDPAWSTSALLASGTFLAGSNPDFFAQGAFTSNGRVFTALGTSTTVGAHTASNMPELVSTIVRASTFGAGDYNHDHVVNAADYTVWRNSLGQVATGLPADGNLNGMIDAGDYDIWKMNFGNTVPGAGSGAAASGVALGAGHPVPEPSTAILLIGALVWSILRPKGAIFRNV
jgi:hypothetical protein